MESADVLQSIAEIGIGLAGFGGIAAGLGYRARGEWSSEDQVRLIGMACVSLAVVFACIVPYVFHHLGSSNPWRIASVALFPLQLLGLGAQIRVNSRGVPAQFSRVAAVVLLVLQVSVLTLLAIVGSGRAASLQFGLYLSAVVLLLFQASLLFLRLLVTSFRSDTPSA